MNIFYLLSAIIIRGSTHRSPALSEWRNGNIQFSSKAYKELANGCNDSFLVSPLAVEVLIALLIDGADNKTVEELTTGLSFPPNKQHTEAAIKGITRTHGNILGVYLPLVIATNIYIREGLKIKQNFKVIAAKTFNTTVQPIDFSKNVTSDINGWVFNRTDQKIEFAFNCNDFNNDSQVILINAIYFHGLLQKPFNVHGTSNKAFYTNGTQEVKVKMMKQAAGFHYYEHAALKATFLEMQLQKSDVSITFVLPKDKGGLSALEANMDKVLEIPKYLLQKVYVQIPQIDVQYKTDFVPILKNFRVQHAFNGSANFSGITGGDGYFQISSIIQKTRVVINEKGKGITAGESRHNLRSSVRKEFEANHPFIFILRSIYGILFIGRYVGPNT